MTDGTNGAWLAAYRASLYALAPLAVGKLVVRGIRNPAYWRRWWERFGWPPADLDPCPVWVHAVSVGEVNAAQPLIEEILRRYPAARMLVTTTTPTGSEQLRRGLGARVEHCYLPYDLRPCVARFLRAVQPRLAVLVETELWPNLIAECRARDVRLACINVRLSQRSYLGYRRFRPLFAPLLATIERFGVQAQADAERLRALGAPSGAVRVTGSIKFDLNLPASAQPVAEALRREWGPGRPVWVAGSTHPGEDEMVLEAFRRLQAQQPGLLLVLVPRHPERFSEVARLAAREGHVVARRSESTGPLPPDVTVYVGDTMGELPVLYAAADVAFVGGSLVPIGGHNVLESCAAGVPVIFGDHMFNFEEIRHQVLAHGAGSQVTSTTGLVEAVARYLGDADLRDRVGHAGRGMVAENRGALSRTLALLEAPLDGALGRV